MATDTSPQLSEVTKKGQAIVDALPAAVVAAHRHQIIVVDIKSGQYAIDRQAFVAFNKLKQLVPDAQVYMGRVGDYVLDRIGVGRKRPSWCKAPSQTRAKRS